MRKPPETHVEVDMVPLIDIVTLLLMFLLIVGDMAKSTTAVPMKLPRADQAGSEKDLQLNTEGRIVVQMKQRSENQYIAVVENHEYELAEKGDNKQLIDYLNRQIDTRKITRGANGEVPFPVKLRIPETAPMREVEKVVMTCARAGLVNVHYAAAKRDH